MGGVFCKKSEPFLNAGCIMYSISIFYFTFYLFGGCVRTQRTPCLRAWIDAPPVENFWLHHCSGLLAGVNRRLPPTAGSLQRPWKCSFPCVRRRFYGFTTPCWIPPYLVAPCDQLGDAIASTGCRNVGAMISQYNYCVDGARCLLPTAFKDSSVRTTASAP